MCKVNYVQDKFCDEQILCWKNSVYDTFCVRKIMHVQVKCKKHKLCINMVQKIREIHLLGIGIFSMVLKNNMRAIFIYTTALCYQDGIKVLCRQSSQQETFYSKLYTRQLCIQIYSIITKNNFSWEVLFNQNNEPFISFNY